MGTIKLSRKDKALIAMCVLLVAVLLCSGGLVAWAVSGRFVGFGIGSVVSVVVVVWMVRYPKVLHQLQEPVGVGVAVGVGLLLRTYPDVLVGLGGILVVAGFLLDTLRRRRRRWAAAEPERALAVLAGRDWTEPGLVLRRTALNTARGSKRSGGETAGRRRGRRSGRGCSPVRRSDRPMVSRRSGPAAPGR